MKKIFITAMISLSGLSLFAQQKKISHLRPYDKDGINKFETAKEDSIPFQGLKVRLGAGFAQQFQMLRHMNSSKYPSPLMRIGPGFNTAAANLNIDAQLAPGISLNLVTYLSSRHHNEAWVKGGYMQIDKSPIAWEPLEKIFRYVTVKAGHYEINYGDAHFRRSDNGQAVYNPFVGNYIMDAFTTEIGGEVDFQYNGFLAVVGATGGEIKGDVSNEGVKRNPSFIAKLGYDKQINEDLRLRLTGSVYTNGGSPANTLYSGDRAGARYNKVMTEKFKPVWDNNKKEYVSGGAVKDTEQASECNFNPKFGNAVTAFMINPFIKYKGLEFFGTIEFAQGKSNPTEKYRGANQYAADLVYRFGKNENLFVGARWNTVQGKVPLTELSPDGGLPVTKDEAVSVDRIQAALGWFITKNILLKGEYVVQNYKDFPSYTKFGKGEFDGFLIEAAVSF